MKSNSKERTKKNPKPKPSDNRGKSLDIRLVIALIGLIGAIIAAILGVFSIDLTPKIYPTPQPSSTSMPTFTLSVEDQLLILGTTATKSAEMTATQLLENVRSTAKVELTIQQVKAELVAQQTQYAIETIQAAEQLQSITNTAVANMTATVQASDIWREQHQFVDEFIQDTHGWNGNTKSASVEIDQSTGVLNFETKKESRIAFWTCDLCSLPIDYNNYSFEVKYFSPLNAKDFNFGLVFGCDQFDSTLVSCQAIQIIDQVVVRLIRTGTSKEYEKVNYPIKTNEKGLVSVRWEVKDQALKLWINNQLIMNSVQLDGGAGGRFGFYADPPGSTVSFDRIEIVPLP